MKRFSSTLTLILSLFLLYAPLTQAQHLKGVEGLQGKFFRVGQQQYQSEEMVLTEMMRANVVYLGETHDRPQDHQAQLDILRSLQRQHPQIIIGMEMFQRPFQPVVDRYINGELTDEQLIEQTEYKKRWGYPWQMYAPILQFAQKQRVPVIALNTPSEVTRKVARAGLESLSPLEKQWIPPKSAILAGPDHYRERMRQIYSEMHHGRSSSSSFERFFLAQVLWDETMAESIAKTLKQNPNALIVVLAGQGHLFYGDGIPNRVARRLNPDRSTPIRQLSILLNPSDDLKTDRTIADYFWYSPE